MSSLFFRVETKVLWKEEWPKEWGLCLSKNRSAPRPRWKQPCSMLSVSNSASFVLLFCTPESSAYHCLLLEAGFLLRSGAWGRRKEMKFRGRDYPLNQQHGGYTYHTYLYCTGELLSNNHLSPQWELGNMDFGWVPPHREGEGGL